MVSQIKRRRHPRLRWNESNRQEQGTRNGVHSLAWFRQAEAAYKPYGKRCRGENATSADLWNCYKAMATHNPLHRGLYADQLERWFRVYDKSQVGAHEAVVHLCSTYQFTACIENNTFICSARVCWRGERENGRVAPEPARGCGTFCRAVHVRRKAWRISRRICPLYLVIVLL